MDSLLKDLRFAVRRLRKSPGFAAAAIIVLALGIGANTAIFSVVNALLLQPLPYPDSSRLVRVWHVPPARSFPGMKIFAVSPANYLDWAAQNHVFEQMAIQTYRSFNVTGLVQPESVQAAVVSASFFSVLETRPMIGRAFLPQDDAAGHGKSVILSYRFWQSRMGGNRNVVGRQLLMNNESYTIVGVMGPNFRMPSRVQFPSGVQVWVPLGWTDKDRAVRDNHNYLVLARLKLGVSVQGAQAEMNTISSRLQAQYPEADAGWGALVVPLQQDIVGEARPGLLLLLGAVGFVLLIACANVANLVLAKTLGRRKEAAIRSALGATRSRLLGQVLWDTVLLSLAGGLLGLVLAQYGVAAILTFLAKELPRTSDIRLDGSVLLFTLIVSVLTGVVAGLLPAWRLTKTNVNEALKQGLGKTDSDSGGGRTRAVLVVCEVALSLVLLVGAGLMIRSLWALQDVNPGFDADNVVTLRVVIPPTKYRQLSQQSAFFDEVLRRVRALPGVVAAGTIDSLPLGGGGSTQPIAIEGRHTQKLSEQPEVAVRDISSGYLEALRIPLVSGRGFTAADAGGKQPVILISRLMAEEFWPHENPLGKRLTLSFVPGVERTIVGVVGDVRDNGLGARRPQATIYLPMNQNPEYGMSLVVRASTPPEGLVAPITQAIHSVDPDQPVMDVETMASVVADSLFQQRFDMLLLSSFAALAVLLAAVGIYSVMAYAVRQRVREISIRMALGAQVGDVLWLVVREGLEPALAGVAIGIAGALALGPLLANLIYGVKTTDPATFAAVSVLLVGVAIFASLLPAYRATNVLPIQALREE